MLHALCHTQVEEVIEQVRLPPRAEIDIDSQFHHVFWFGDLNYRVQLQSVDNRERAIEDHMAEVQQMIDAEKWSSLLAADQLQQELKAHRVRSSQCTLCHPSG